VENEELLPNEEIVENSAKRARISHDLSFNTSTIHDTDDIIIEEFVAAPSPPSSPNKRKRQGDVDSSQKKRKGGSWKEAYRAKFPWLNHDVEKKIVYCTLPKCKMYYLLNQSN
jgi:hypothetical protein